MLDGQASDPSRSYLAGSSRFGLKTQNSYSVGKEGAGNSSYVDLQAMEKYN